ncbi:MAG TPA: DinB family protein [Acidimicrobiales bacterium]|nr:DinB family protein [Acidimicrobiales bacterium]
MPEEFGGDLAGSVFWGADLSGSRFRDVDLTGVRISHAWLIDVEIDALVDRLVINGVDVTDHVNEHDPWYPLRTVLRASTPPSFRAGWAALEAEWAATVDRALALPGELVHDSVDGEWSFVETLRHLVFAMDKWFTAPVLGGAFDPIGLPNGGSVDFPWPGLDLDRKPSFSDVLTVRANRTARFREHVAAVEDADLDRSVEVLENGASSLRQCLQTVLEEEFWHHRYAVRDLDRLEATEVPLANRLRGTANASRVTASDDPEVSA